MPAAGETKIEGEDGSLKKRWIHTEQMEGREDTENTTEIISNGRGMSTRRDEKKREMTGRTKTEAGRV